MEEIRRGGGGREVREIGRWREKENFSCISNSFGITILFAHFGAYIIKRISLRIISNTYGIINPVSQEEGLTRTAYLCTFAKNVTSSATFGKIKFAARVCFESKL